MAGLTPAVPVDVVVTLLGVVLADAALLGLAAPGRFVRAAAGAPLLLFLPGYALVTVLFPRRRTADVAGQVYDGVRRPLPGFRPPTTAERLALGFGVSVALLPLVGVGLGQTVGFGLYPVVVTLSLLTLVGAITGWIRRLRVARDQRYSLPLVTWTVAGWRGLREADTPALAAARLVVAVLAVTSVAGLGYAVVSAGSGGGYTDLLVLTESDGEYVAGDYPTSLTTADPASLTARVENQERRPSNYTLVVQLQTVERSDGNVTVTDRRTVASGSTSLADGEVWLFDHDVTGQDPGDDRRITYLLYRGDAPGSPSTATAYRHVHLWVDVTAGGN
ncbi:DUF1616 domain-containing protein [Halobacteriales archaeon Cl-PHB]